MAEEVGLPKTDIHQIIMEDLYMRKIADTWILHHDNAPSHTSITGREFLAQNKITTLLHQPYSPDLAPCDLFLFPKLKTHLKGHHFGTVENVQAAATRALNNISSEVFQHWNRCS
jgi:transposase